ncbi:MAG: hypothetical protein CVU41_10445 [Chloroflexi bacterium HGW-Chloroflexi-3]|nr:MAG: hypothetical protein CVU41_10445 [Chloroflexi bacterium HGW-Chloroflexi-3]
MSRIGLSTSIDKKKETFFGKDFIDGPFVLFSTQHLIAILGIILVGTLIILSQRRTTPQQRLRVRWGVAFLLVANETMRINQQQPASWLFFLPGLITL